MSTITITQPHTMGVEAAKAALQPFEADIAKFGLKLVWNGSNAELKGPFASGDLKLTDTVATVTVKLGMAAKIAGANPDKIQASIEKRLKSALTGEAVT